MTSILEQLDQLLCDDVIVIVKLHRYVLKKINLQKYRHLRLPHPLYENYRFVNISDGLITDYSSVFFDYANTKREIILFPYDYDKYMEQRGTYCGMDEFPFPQVSTVEELAGLLNKHESFIPDDQYEVFLERFCKYDTPRNPKYINNVMLGESPSSDIQIYDYCRNLENAYCVYFISNLAKQEEKDQFIKLMENAKADDLFVFAHWSFRNAAEALFAEYKDTGVQFVVTPGQMPAAKSEYIKLILYRKFGLFKKTAKRLYTDELSRILPNIKIKQLIN